MSNAAILLAAGKSSRMQQSVEDKILTRLNGKPAILYSAEAFIQSGTISQFVIVYRDEKQKNIINETLYPVAKGKVDFSWVKGGAERQDSVYNGLTEVSRAHEHVFIHDCARPLIRPDTLKKLLQLVQKDKAATVARPVTDTIKRISHNDPSSRNLTLSDIDRSMLWAMETPQVFQLDLIINAYKEIRSQNKIVTDDTAALAEQNKTVSLLNPGYPNIKLTTPSDLPYLEYLLNNQNQTTAPGS